MMKNLKDSFLIEDNILLNSDSFDGFYYNYGIDCTTNKKINLSFKPIYKITNGKPRIIYFKTKSNKIYKIIKRL